jgi:hypothetical protein
VQKILTPLILLFSLGCPGSKDGGGDDTQASTVPSCDGSGQIGKVTIGTGAGSEFYLIEDGDTVGLDVAPQGGFGVSVRAMTTGLKADDIVDVNLVTEIDGVQSGQFLSEGVQLYCQEDGTGLLWGVVVGFDADLFATNDDLLALNGQEAVLIVEITDANGETYGGQVTTIVEVGG